MNGYQLDQSGEKGKRKHNRSMRLTDPTLPLKNSNIQYVVRSRLY